MGQFVRQDHLSSLWSDSVCQIVEFITTLDYTSPIGIAEDLPFERGRDLGKEREGQMHREKERERFGAIRKTE